MRWRWVDNCSWPRPFICERSRAKWGNLWARTWARRWDFCCALTHAAGCSNSQGGSERLQQRAVLSARRCLGVVVRLLDRCLGHVAPGAASGWRQRIGHAAAYSMHAWGHQRRDSSVMTLPRLGSERLVRGITAAASHAASTSVNGDPTASGSMEAAGVCPQMMARAAGRGGAAQGNLDGGRSRRSVADWVLPW
jgi:hypothetical protein